MVITEKQSDADSEILKIIEDMRMEMHKIARLRGLSHPSVLEVSVKIDEMVNQYLQLRSRL